MKSRFQKLNVKGFTIIEVMIVLAIAGVIMAIVFLAIPQLQRNSRDNARQSAVNRVNSELQTYGSTNSGSFPWAAGTWTTFYNNYVNGKVSDSANGQLIWQGGSGTTSTNFVRTCPGGTAQNAACNAANIMTGAGNAVIIPYGKCNNGAGTNTSTTGIAYASQTVPATPSTTVSTYAFIMQLDRTGTYYCIDNG